MGGRLVGRVGPPPGSCAGRGQRAEVRNRTGQGSTTESACRWPQASGRPHCHHEAAPGSSRLALSRVLRACQGPGCSGGPRGLPRPFASPGAADGFWKLDPRWEVGRSSVFNGVAAVSHGATQVFRSGLRRTSGARPGNDPRGRWSGKWRESMKTQRPSSLSTFGGGSGQRARGPRRIGLGRRRGAAVRRLRPRVRGVCACWGRASPACAVAGAGSRGLTPALAAPSLLPALQSCLDGGTWSAGA